MVAGKVAALAEAQFTAASTVLSGAGHNAAKEILHGFRKRVRANKNRLSRRRRAS